MQHLSWKHKNIHNNEKKNILTKRQNTTTARKLLRPCTRHKGRHHISRIPPSAIEKARGPRVERLKCRFSLALIRLTRVELHSRRSTRQRDLGSRNDSLNLLEIQYHGRHVPEMSLITSTATVVFSNIVTVASPSSDESLSAQ